MKGLYFWIGIAIFLISAYLYLSENRRFFEGFTNGATQDVLAGGNNTAGGSQQGTQNPAAGNTTQAATAASSSQTPGTTSPTNSPATTDTINQLKAKVDLLKATIQQKGGEVSVASKLSAADQDFLDELITDASGARITTLTEDKAQIRIAEVKTATDYLNAPSFLTTTPATSALKTYVNENKNHASSLPSQFTMNGNSMSELLANVVGGQSGEFAPGRSETERVTASELQDLMTRIERVISTMRSLNTTEPVILARIQNLETLRNDLREMKASIQSGTMKPTDVPIKVGDARRFLAATIVVESQMPNLYSAPEAPAGNSGGGGAQNGAAELLNMAKYLKWSLNVSFDSDLYAREQMAQRVDKILHLLQTKQISGSEAKAILETLNTISSKIGPQPNSNKQVFKADNAEVDDDRSAQHAQNRGYLPDDKQLEQASAGGFEEVRASQGNAYEKRGSAAYAVYAYADATEPNYKDRLVNLCGQITRSGLGTGEELGCMKDIQNAGTNYGWKGAYLMVCSRLKDTWGGNYPAMFGCPKTTDRWA